MSLHEHLPVPAPSPATAESSHPSQDEPVQFPITNELDLHTFNPAEIADLLPDYFAECIKRSILTVRVVHGKGTGTLRERVHHLLEDMPEVTSWQWPAGEQSGGWGATWVWLRPDAA